MHKYCLCYFQFLQCQCKMWFDHLVVVPCRCRTTTSHCVNDSSVLSFHQVLQCHAAHRALTAGALFLEEDQLPPPPTPPALQKLRDSQISHSWRSPSPSKPGRNDPVTTCKKDTWYTPNRFLQLSSKNLRAL